MYLMNFVGETRCLQLGMLLFRLNVRDAEFSCQIILPQHSSCNNIFCAIFYIGLGPTLYHFIHLSHRPTTRIYIVRHLTCMTIAI